VRETRSGKFLTDLLARCAGCHSRPSKFVNFHDMGYFVWSDCSGPEHMELYATENKPYTLCAVKVHSCPLLVFPLQYTTAYPPENTNTDSGA
jgi:hypothetical protein